MAKKLTNKCINKRLGACQPKKYICVLNEVLPCKFIEILTHIYGSIGQSFTDIEMSVFLKNARLVKLSL